MNNFEFNKENALPMPITGFYTVDIPVVIAKIVETMLEPHLGGSLASICGVSTSVVALPASLPLGLFIDTTGMLVTIYISTLAGLADGINDGFN